LNLSVFAGMQVVLNSDAINIVTGMALGILGSGKIYMWASPCSCGPGKLTLFINASSSKAETHMLARFNYESEV